MLYILFIFGIILLLFVQAFYWINFVNVIKHLPKDKHYETNNFFDNPTVFVIIQVITKTALLITNSISKNIEAKNYMVHTKLSKTLLIISLILTVIFVIGSLIYNIIQIVRYRGGKSEL